MENARFLLSFLLLLICIDSTTAPALSCFYFYSLFLCARRSLRLGGGWRLVNSCSAATTWRDINIAMETISCAFLTNALRSAIGAVPMCIGARRPLNTRYQLHRFRIDRIPMRFHFWIRNLFSDTIHACVAWIRTSGRRHDVSIYCIWCCASWVDVTSRTIGAIKCEFGTVQTSNITLCCKKWWVSARQKKNGTQIIQNCRFWPLSRCDAEQCAFHAWLWHVVVAKENCSGCCSLLAKIYFRSRHDVVRFCHWGGTRTSPSTQTAAAASARSGHRDKNDNGNHTKWVCVCVLGDGIRYVCTHKNHSRFILKEYYYHCGPLKEQSRIGDSHKCTL